LGSEVLGIRPQRDSTSAEDGRNVASRLDVRHRLSSCYLYFSQTPVNQVKDIMMKKTLFNEKTSLQSIYQNFKIKDETKENEDKILY